MSYIVKQADIHKDKAVLLNLLVSNRERKEFQYDLRYDWLYLKNPCGEATAWIIWDEKKQYPAGFTAVYPRKMLVKGRELICWNCGDFSIEPAYRTLGVAVKLRKEAKSSVDRREIPFLYAHPNDRMAQVHLRAGHTKIAQMKRYALPIRVSRYLAGHGLGKPFGAAADPVYSGLMRIRFRRTGDFENLTGSEMQFTDAHRHICEEIAKVRSVVGLRDPQYLTWKFKDHPITHYELFNYFEKGKLVGYVIYAEQEGTIFVGEMMVSGQDAVQSNLLSTFVNYCVRKRKQAHVISFVTQEFNPLVKTLEAQGFRFRDDSTSSVMSYCAIPEMKPIVEDGRNWFMNEGDRDA